MEIISDRHYSASNRVTCGNNYLSSEIMSRSNYLAPQVTYFNYQRWLSSRDPMVIAVEVRHS
jgi:hypothetical protein